MKAGTSNRVAIVTGSTKGIGRAIAFALASQGTAIVVTGREQAHAEEIAAEIANAGGQAIGLGFNMEILTQLDALIEKTIAHFGRLDILVNNAISHTCLLPPEDFDDEAISRAISANLTHNYLLCCKAFPHLKLHKGNIVNIGSIVTRRHLLGLPLYNLVKGGILNMTKILASEWADAGVRVNAINPGFVRTQAFNEMGMPPEVVEASYRLYGEYQPLCGVGSPADIAHAVNYLSSIEARFITGSTIDIDGGYSVKGMELYS